ncbi:MAG: biotin/lipoyl-binding protein [Chloroflexi bacterium]|nr:biotin/lipoyl-binding protein [Chloroflexota bacterium]
MVNGLPYDVAAEQAPAAPRAPVAHAPGARPSGAVPGSVLAPVSGTITAIKAQPGQAVEAGAVLLVLEAMKMENEIKAPRKGLVKEVLVARGSKVTEGQALAILE